MPPLLSILNLSAGYSASHPVFQNVSFSLLPGEILLLKGPNGIGKSTLFQCVAGLMRPLSGSISILSKPLSSYPRRSLAHHLAYLPQQTDPSALIGASVRDVVALGRLSRSSWFHSAAASPSSSPAVDSAISRLGLSPLASRKATELSGGEARRMFLAACLAQESPILLLDEPFNQIDSQTRSLILQAIHHHLSHGGAILLSSHDEAPLHSLPYRTLSLEPLALPPAPSPRPTPHLRPFLGASIALLILSLLALSLFADAHSFTPSQFSRILTSYRLPRLLTALFTGGILSTAGLLYQTVFRNPMASPYTLGTASGAAFGVTLAIATSLLPLPIAAFLGALLSIAVVRLCSGHGGSARLLLSGIACSFLFSAASLLIQYRLSPEKLSHLVHWGFGSIVAAQPAPLALLATAFLAALLCSLAGRPLDALLAGDEAAASFGVPIHHARISIFLVAALLTACAVSVCGPIAFVGLVVPHIVRFIAPSKHARMLPITALYGALFLALCDTLPRLLLSGLTPPVGILTALLGGPTLLFLLHHQPRH